MTIDKQTIFFSATRCIKCSKQQALDYFSHLTEINIDRLAAGKCLHLFEVSYWGSDGLLIAGADFHVASLPKDLCSAIAELLADTNNHSLDISYSVCSPVFSESSHHGGIVRVHRDGNILLASATFEAKS